MVPIYVCATENKFVITAADQFWDIKSDDKKNLLNEVKFTI